MTDVKIVTLTGVNVWRYKFRLTLTFMQLAPVALHAFRSCPLARVGKTGQLASDIM